MLASLARLWPFDPQTGSRVEIRVSAHNDAVIGRVVNGIGEVDWLPAMIDAPALRIALFNGDFAAAISPGQAGLSIAVETLKARWPDLERYAWQGAPIEILAESIDTAWPWEPRFVGKITGYARQGQKLTLTASVDTEPFAIDLLSATYAGTGGKEGGLDMTGKPKPLALGWAMNVEPVLIDPTNSVYQFSGYGPIEAITTLFERGSAFTAAVADHANYAALVAATIAPGKWASCLAEGLIRLGAPAYGVITGDIKGHAVGGTTPRLTGEIIAAMATIAGLDPDLIDGDSLDSLDAAVPYPVNLVFTAQTSLLDAAQRVALPCNAQAGLSLNGRMFVARTAFDGLEDMLVRADGTSFPQVVESREDSVSPPFWRVVMGANPSWRVHTTEEIAFAAPIVPRGAYSASETYREGNIVSQADGSEWLYISLTPTSGNAPPTWPTTSNTWWSNSKPPLKADGITYTDGTPIEDLQPAEAGADVTATAQVVIELGSDQTIAADYTGAVTSTALAAIIWSPRVNRGGSSIKLDNATTYALSNVSGVVSGTGFVVDNTNGSSTKGDVTIASGTVLSLNAAADLTITVGGVAQPRITLRLAKVLASPPAGGSSGSYPKVVTWTDGEFVSLDTTSYTAVVTPLKTVTLASGETLYGTAPLAYSVDGTTTASRSMTFKWQYSVAGAASWNDFGTGITGSSATSDHYVSGELADGTEGSVAVTQSKSGLGAGDYDVRMVALCSATGRNCTAYGLATIEAKT